MGVSGELEEEVFEAGAVGRSQLFEGEALVGGEVADLAGLDVAAQPGSRGYGVDAVPVQGLGERRGPDRTDVGAAGVEQLLLRALRDDPARVR